MPTLDQLKTYLYKARSFTNLGKEENLQREINREFIVDLQGEFCREISYKSTMNSREKSLLLSFVFNFLVLCFIYLLSKMSILVDIRD